MNTAIQGPHTALKYEVEVQANGQVALELPFAPGARVVIFVVPEQDEIPHDLTAATESTLGFWDNPEDDEDWNNA